MFRKKSRASDQLTVSSLKKSVANSVVSKIRIRTIMFIGRIKKFYRDYKMPAVASTAFLLVLVALAIARQLEQTSLLALRNEVSSDGNGYSILLRNDETDEFTRNDTTEDNPQQPGGSSSPSNSTQSTSNSFTLETGSGSTPTTGGGSGSGSGSTGGGGGNNGGIPSETQPFSATIDAFRQGSVTLQCNNPSKPNKGSCAKVYAFSAGVRTLNGPGTVNYAWQTDAESGGATGNFFVSEQSAITTVSREISIACTRSTNFSIQFSIVSPTFANSNTITVNHNCNEV